MARARKNVVLQNQSAVYHCISRCVRRAFLCGMDSFSDSNYEHRRLWIENRIEYLSKLFCINIYSYAVMSNHYHVVLATDFEKMKNLSDREIVTRWLTLTNKQSNPDGKPSRITEATIEACLGNDTAIQMYRERLCNVSWFMRYINEWVARKANLEDQCKGRFWEGRFKCQRVDDAGALLTCMSYVDLNPVRAAMAETPEESEFTSVFKRVRSKQAQMNLEVERQIQAELRETEKLKSLRQQNLKDLKVTDFLTPIAEIFSDNGIDLDDYLSLIDYAGRELKEGKRGQIPPHLCGILTRLDLDHENWVKNVKCYGSLFHYYAGKVQDLCDAMKHIKMNSKSSWCWGRKGSLLMYRKSPVSP